MATWTAKRVGAKNALWLDDADRGLIAGRHFATKANVCQFDGQEWPCDAFQVMHDLVATRNSIMRLYTGSF